MTQNDDSFLGKRLSGRCQLGVLLGLLAWLLPALACADAMYECHDKDGPVFSDTPCPGAERINLPSPNVIDTDSPAQQAVSQPSAPAYTAFIILSPENEGTDHTNTGRFQVSLALTPALQDGNAISISLDGTQLPTLRYSLQFDVTPEEWASAAAVNAQHLLAAAVVDSSGNPLITANPVQFYVHRATVHR
jgi:hypothetical protein